MLDECNAMLDECIKGNARAWTVLSTIVISLNAQIDIEAY